MQRRGKGEKLGELVDEHENGECWVLEESVVWDKWQVA